MDKKILPKMKFVVNGSNLMGKSYTKNWKNYNLDRKNVDAVSDKFYLNTGIDYSHRA